MPAGRMHAGERPLRLGGARLAVLGACSLAALGAPAAAGAPPPAAFDVLHYEVRITPDFARHAVAGESEITLRSLDDRLQDLEFSDNALAIDRATVSGRAVDVSHGGDAMTFHLPAPLAKGRTATLRVAYHGVPARGMTFGDRALHTGYFTSGWTICTQDRPGDKASIGLTLRLPAGMRSIGVGTRRWIRTDSAGLEAHRWQEDTPYSSYLYGFAAGDLHEVTRDEGGVKLVFASESAPAESLAALFAPTGDMLRFFESKAGVPIPHATYAQLLVPGSEAQEAAGFSLLGEDELSPTREDPQEDWAIAHELAHQWWGNLVTCRTWNDFWLNEGITTFMVAAWKEHRWGRAAYERELRLATARRQVAIDAGLDVPLAYAGAYPSLRVRRAIQYSKGALFMDALRRRLGERAFWNALERFTRAHAGGVVDSRDFQKSCEAASGLDLSALFDAWVY